MYYLSGVLAQLLHIRACLRRQIEPWPGRAGDLAQPRPQTVPSGHRVLGHVAVPLQSNQHPINGGLANPKIPGEVGDATLAPRAAEGCKYAQRQIQRFEDLSLAAVAHLHLLLVSYKETDFPVYEL